MTLPSTKVALVGGGNVATHLGRALEQAGFPLARINSRTLADIPEADVYIFSVKDDALPEVLSRFPRREGLFVHTAGSVPMSVFKPFADRFGVLYPLQTFNKERAVDFSKVPLFIEANRPEDEQLLETIASRLSGRVVKLASESRKDLHLAAVFACNFVNHLYALSGDILEKNGLSWDLLRPLIEETADKIRELSPREAQTGPAIRHDQKTMEAHLALLADNPSMQAIYRLLSESIATNGEQ